MPYSGASDSSLPSNVKKLPTEKKKKWVSTFNSVYKDCVDGGGSTSSCETKAFKVANGTIEQTKEGIMNNRTLLQRVWGGFLDSIGIVDDETDFELIPRKDVASARKQRSTAMGRVYEQIYANLRELEDWAYPMDVYVGDDGSSLFALVTQSGKLFQVPLTVSKDSVSLGDWVQVEETFTPVTQNRFFIKRQKDGSYRWTAIAATSVLNRVGEIDSVKLFDSFIDKAEQRGKYPRLDFYHWGETDTDVWEFGTADYLARDGVCYIASGTFDEDHPLAKATIRSCEESGDDEWGCSIEFYAYAEPEKILLDPEVEVPVYNEGENTRISVVLEEDAAGLFTRMGVKEGIHRAMDKATRKALEKLYGEDAEGLQAFLDQFEEGVDQTNQRVKNDKLIHRAKTEPEAEIEDEDEDEASEDEEELEDEDSELVLDESAVVAITQQMMETEEFKQLSTSIAEIKELITQSILDREADLKEIEQLKKSNSQLTKIVGRLNKDENEKKSEYLQDLPSRKRQTVSFRARDARNEGDEEEEDVLESFEDIANRTLDKLAVSY